MPCVCLVGLGNPGRPGNRHNAGHRVLDRILRKLSGPGLAARRSDIRLFPVKTDVFMNNSGKFVQKITKNLGNHLLWIVHDDLEVRLAKVKWKWGGSAGGHNGLRDIISLYGPEFGRIRVGIGRPTEVEVREYVLQDHCPDELEAMSRVEEKLAELVLENLDLLAQKDLASLRTRLV